jgi:signal peptidase II
MASRVGRAAAFLAIFLCSAGFDQASKGWAHSLPPGDPQPVISGVWDWELARNPGIAFSTFAGSNAQVLLSILAAVMLVIVGVLAYRTRPDQRLERAGFALIAGGALGNLIDRVRDGAVTDFIRWRIGEHRWPIFNVADAFLVIGVALILLSPLVHRLHKVTT